MSKTKSTSFLDTNENVVKLSSDGLLYSLTNIKLNRNCPLPDTLLNSNITALHLDIPTSNDPAYEKEVFEKIGKNVQKLVIFRLGDKLFDEELRERWDRHIPCDFLRYFPSLRELHLRYKRDLDHIEYFPPGLETLHIQHYCYALDESTYEKIRGISSLKVLKAGQMNVNTADEGKNSDRIFRKYDETVLVELKKICNLEFYIKTDEQNLLEKENLQLSHITGIIIDPFDKWTFESFDGLQKLENLKFLEIEFSKGEHRKCLFPKANFGLPSIQELVLKESFKEKVCEICFLNLIKICSNVKSVTLKGSFPQEIAKRFLEIEHLQVFRYKNFRFLEKVAKLEKLEEINFTMDFNEVNNLPEMPNLKKCVLAVRIEADKEREMLIKKCPNVTTFKVSSIEAGSVYGFSLSVSRSLPHMEYLRIKIFHPTDFQKLEPLHRCKNLKTLHLVMLPDFSNSLFYDRSENLTFDTERKLFETIPSLNLLIVNTEFGKRYFYRGDLFDLKTYFAQNILKYRQPQHTARYIREKLKSVTSGVIKTNPSDSEDLSDVCAFLGVDVKARTMESSLTKTLQRSYFRNSSDEDSDSDMSEISEITYLMENSSGSSSYDLNSMDGKFSDTDISEDFSDGDDDY